MPVQYSVLLLTMQCLQSGVGRTVLTIARWQAPVPLLIVSAGIRSCVWCLVLSVYLGHELAVAGSFP